MQDVVHDAVLADRGRRGLDREAKSIKAVGLDQGTVSIGDLVGFAVEQIEPVKLDAPAVFKTIADAAVEDTGRRRSSPSAGYAMAAS